MQVIQKIALIFTIVGALNWGLIGFLDFNLVESLFGNEMLERVIYSIVGVCALINIPLFFMNFDKKNM